MKTRSRKPVVTPFYNRSAIPFVIGIYSLAIAGVALWGMPSLMLPGDRDSDAAAVQPLAVAATVQASVGRQSTPPSPDPEQVLASGTVIPVKPRAAKVAVSDGNIPEAAQPVAPRQNTPAEIDGSEVETPAFPGAIVATEMDSPASIEAPAPRPIETAISPTVPTVARAGGAQRPRAARELVEAVETGDLSRARTLALSGDSVRAITETGESLLMRASWYGHLPMVRWLLSAGANPNFQSVKGQSALINAAIRGHGAVVELLLAGDARVNHASRDGRTGLMAAAWNGHDDVVSLLVRRGADVTTRDRFGRTALHYAAASGQERSASILLAAGANASLRDESGRSSLELARDHGLDLGSATR